MALVVVRWTTGALCAACVAQTIGCFRCLYGHSRGVLFLSGQLLNTDTQRGLTDSVVDARTFTDGEETGLERAIVFGETPTPGLPPPTEEGSFVVPFVTRISPACEGPLGPPLPAPEFPQPDQIEVIVVRDACVQRFLIDINEDTVVDLDFPDNVIELKDMILVPPCEEQDVP